MNSATGGGNGAYAGGTNQNGQSSQNALQQQLVQQLSQQLSQQMSQKFPQPNILSALANVQAQMQNPQQQPPPDFMALARSGNLANVTGLLSPANGVNSETPGGEAVAPKSQQADAAANPPAADQKSHNEGGRQGLQHEVSKAAQKPAAPPPSLGHVGEIRAGFQGQPSTAALSSATSDAVKDERRKAPGSVIVPCRARGMPMDHNFKTAYFVIPENVRHGEELICSYFACRNAGVKFRYCSHCKVPVAKRNFRKRHKHGDTSGKDAGDDEEQSATEEDGASDEGETADIPPHGAVPSQVVASRNIKDAIPSQVTTANDGVNKKRTEDGSLIPSQVTTRGTNRKAKPQPKKAAAGKYSSTSDSRSVCMRSGDERLKVVESRRKHWARLLDKRPQTKDGEAMSLWLMQVLAVSDLWKPLNEAEDMPTTSLDLIRECARAGTQKGREANVSKPAAASESATKDELGSSDSQDTKDDSENQGVNDAENSFNGSDNPGMEADGGVAAGEEKAKEPSKKKSLLLKKRPVSDLQEGKEDKSLPPACKPKV